MLANRAVEAGENAFAEASNVVKVKRSFIIFVDVLRETLQLGQLIPYHFMKGLGPNA